MKKFKYAIGIAAMALFGACSSDAPEIIDNGDEGDGKGMYLAIELDGQSTRGGTVAADEKGSSALEDLIDHIQIYVLDKDGNFYFSKKVAKKDITSGVAKFSVTTNTFNEMSRRAGENWQILVYANGTTLPEKSAENLLYGQTSDIVWGKAENKANPEAEGYNPNTGNGFIMSNVSSCVGTLESIGSADGTEANPWKIRSNVELSRLATRFDYATTNKASYTVQTDNSVQLSISGMDVETFAGNVHRIAKFSENGRKAETGNTLDKAWVSLFAASGDKKYRVTDVYENDPTDDEFSVYTDYSYSLVSGKNLYRRPNTISISATPTFGNTPFVVVKAEISGTKVAESAAEGEEIYALNGYLIGGVRELYTMKNTEGFVFKITAPEGITFTEDEEQEISQVEDNVNRLLQTYNFVMKTEGEETVLDIAKNQANIKKNLNTPEVYSYDNGYFTYYAAMIIHDDSKGVEDSWKYGVSRNTVYELGVASFRKLGNNGEGHPGEGPSSTDLSDLLMQVSIKVLNWKLNTKNTGIEF